MTLDVFIPFWGDPGLLYDAVRSVQAQNDPDWRLTVIDDCYPDVSVADFFQNLDDARVTYTRNTENVGITENFRECVRRAEATHLTILGCDDLLHPNYVEVVKRTIAAVPHADVIQPGVQVIDEHGAPSQPLTDRVKHDLLAPRRGTDIAVLRGPEMATSLIRGNWLYWPSLTFRTETIRRFDFRDGFPVIQDLALLMDMAFAGATLAYDPEIAFSYRRHSESASQKTLLDGERFADERRYYALAARLAGDLGWRRTRRTARLRIVSRLHGAAELPTVLRKGTRAGIKSALAHVLSI
ncbi:glycosyltransferase involved in cell wall biosynthesis [Microbacterium sp. 1154]|uniref:glycosyltransferase family 2 protein n=1 Tax=Microbacterium sp. 1154 TaxID=2817733 RepID=UPI000E26CC1B|nr:glycosyltransferase [Microbacterium sp. 1154]MDR6690436.1 glycosyltransferase involved in cell wall biosynthesis [Microbacterium sp. 1154]